MKKKIVPLTRIDRKKKPIRYRVIVSIQDEPSGSIYQKSFVKEFLQPIGMEKFISLILSNFDGFFTTCRRAPSGALNVHFVTSYQGNRLEPDEQLEKLKDFVKLALTFDDVLPEEYDKVSDEVKSMFQERDKEEFILLQAFVPVENPTLVTSVEHDAYRENLTIIKRVREQFEHPIELMPFVYKTAEDLPETGFLNAYCALRENTLMSGYVYGAVVRKHQQEVINCLMAEYEKINRKEEMKH